MNAHRQPDAGRGTSSLGADAQSLHIPTDGDGAGGANAEGVGTSARGGELADDALVVDRAVARSLGLTLPPATQRWALRDLVAFVDAREAYVRERERRQRGTGRRSTAADGQHGGGGGGGGQYSGGGGGGGGSAGAALVRALHRVVLLTFIAARPHLARAAHESLSALRLSGAHEWAASFELAAFDLMLDAERRPWLLEVNTSPSLKEEEKVSAAGGAAGGTADTSGMARGDLAIKMRVLGDMLALVDAVPDAKPPEGMGGALAGAEARGDGGMGGEGAGWPAEAMLSTLLEQNSRDGHNSSTGGATCVRRWRLGACRHCPTTAQLAHLWRASAERRRAAGWQPLVPSDDPEWASLARQRDRDGVGSDLEVMDTPPSDHALQEAWVRAAGGDGGCPAREPRCVHRRWDAMLCPPDGNGNGKLVR